MLHLLALCTLLLTTADHLTTWLCLRAPVAGFAIYEANPIAAWLFAQLGLVPGLLVDSAVTLAGLAFLVKTGMLAHGLKLAFLGVVVLATSLAVANNVRALEILGLI